MSCIAANSLGKSFRELCTKHAICKSQSSDRFRYFKALAFKHCQGLVMQGICKMRGLANCQVPFVFAPEIAG